MYKPRAKDIPNTMHSPNHMQHIHWTALTQMFAKNIYMQS